MELKNGSKVIFPTKEEGKIVNIINICGTKNYKILIFKGGPQFNRNDVITRVEGEFKKLNYD